MLTPSQINPIQIEWIRKIEREETQRYSRKTGRAVDPKCPEVQRRVVNQVQRRSPAWRAQIEANLAARSPG